MDRRSEADYRAELARGRIQPRDIDAVLDSEADAMVFPRLSRHSLRRAMITLGVREFDAATILWRTEQGDLTRDFRQAALRALFDACFAHAVAHEEEPTTPRPVDEVIHPWLTRLCSVFLDQGMAYWPMPNRDKGFYESVRTLLSQPSGISPSADACRNSRSAGKQNHFGPMPEYTESFSEAADTSNIMTGPSEVWR